MKNLLFILTFLFVSTTAFGQKYFNNNGGDNLWSNASNWNGGIPGANAKVIINKGNPIVDVAATCKMIQLANNANISAVTTITATGGNTLTITGNNTNDGTIILNTHHTKTLKFDLPVVYSGTVAKNIRIYNATAGGATSAKIIFGSNSTFTYPDNKTMKLNVNQDDKGTKSVTFDGAINGGQLIIEQKAIVEFGANYDGSNQTGGILMNGNGSTLTVNTTSGTFLKAGELITTAYTSTGHSIIIADGAGDVFKGNIQQKKYNLNFTVNENQSAVGTIKIGEQNLKLDIGDDVTSVAFADSSGETWHSLGKLVITGAQDNEVSIGTNASGLTADQLGKTTLNGSAVQISANGEIAALNVVTTTFESAGTDNLWSTDANWSTGTPTANTKVTLKSNLVVDSSQEIGQLKVSSAASGDIEVTATNSAILTINGNAVTQPIQNNNAGEKFTLNLPIVFSSTDTETVQVNGAGAGSITFGSSSELTLTATTKFVAKADRSINMNGTLSGAGQFQSGDASTIKFGSTSNNAGHSGGFKMLGGGSNIEVNTADNGTFLASGNTISNDSGTTGNTITVNTANVFKGNVEVTDEPMTLNIKANQTGAGVVTIGTGTLSLALDAAVTSLAFADSSAATWGAGALTITGVGVDEISFGTSNSAITADQLSKITVDGFSATINSSGKINSNFAPVAVDDTLTVAEDATLTSKDVIANDTDADANTLTLTAATTAGTGTIAINSDGLSVDYTPAANFNGTELITYTVSDGERTDATGTLTVTVTAVADTPVAVANSLTVTEDAALTSTDVIANDTDGDGDTLSLTAASTAGTGTVAINADGLSVDYTPAANFNGTEVITYTVSDGTLTDATGTFTVTVTAVNDAPVAVANTLTVAEDAALTSTNVIANDTDVESDTLSLTAATTTGTGTVAVNADGLSVDYTPAANFNGTEVVTYTVSDGTDTTNGTFTVTVTAVNDAPVAVDDTSEFEETSALTSIDVIANDTDVDGDTLSLTAATTAGTGTVAINSDGLSVDYTPADNFNGTEVITYTVSDGTLTDATGTLTITVKPVNDAPVAVANTLTVSEDAALTSTDVIANDTDVDGDTLSLTAATTAGTGTVAVNADGLSVDYSPAANFNGTEVITYTVSDGKLTDATGTLTVTVTAVNDTPVSSDQSVSTIEDIPLEITLSGSDIDGDDLSYLVVDKPSKGTVSITGSKATYTSESGYFGSDTFTYKVNDGTVDSSNSTISITITSNDLDEDGILNDDDECPNTPQGKVVDYKGCEIFGVADNNNKIEITSATCIGNSDGSIKLNVEDSSYNYTVTITGKENVRITGDNKSASVNGLAKGTYTVCFLIDDAPNYEQCFDVLIEEPKALSVFIDVDNDNRTTSIQLGGSKSYTIDVNGQKYTTNKDNFTTTLPTGLSLIKVYTDLDCQGIIEKEVFISEDIMYYPNPTQDDINVHIGGEDKKIMVSVFSGKGDLIYTKQQPVQDMSRLTEIDLSIQSSGTYIVVLESKTVRKTFKIVKK